jgi:hypothetical protein
LEEIRANKPELSNLIQNIKDKIWIVDIAPVFFFPFHLVIICHGQIKI